MTPTTAGRSWAARMTPITRTTPAGRSWAATTVTTTTSTAEAWTKTSTSLRMQRPCSTAHPFKNCKDTIIIAVGLLLATPLIIATAIGENAENQKDLTLGVAFLGENACRKDQSTVPTSGNIVPIVITVGTIMTT